MTQCRKGRIIVSRLLAGLVAVQIARANPPIDPIGSLQVWLAEPIGRRGKLADQPFATAPLTKNQAGQARAMLWENHVKLIHSRREKKWNSRAITVGEHTLRLREKTSGSKPKDEWSLYISMHGGGNAPPVSRRQGNSPVFFLFPCSVRK